MVGKKKKLSVTERRLPPIRPRVERVRLPPGSLVRLVFFAALSVIAAAWAIWRHYTVPPSRMLVPAPAPTASEIEIEP